MPMTASTMPPISSVSAEILVLILDTLLIDSAASKGDPIACGPEDDTILTTSEVIRGASHVCRFWRSVCLGNPLWWSTISIVHPWRLEEVVTNLERAQNCPLDLRIFGHEGFTTRTRNVTQDFSKKHFPPTLAMYTDLFNIIFPILPRCRVLHLRGVFTNENRVLSFEFLERVVDTSMHSLKKLIFEGDLINYEDKLIQRKRPLFSGTPMLQHLRLIGIDISSFPFTSRSLPSPSSRTSSPSLSRSPPPVFYSKTLTTLHLSNAATSVQTSINQLKSTLTACPSLITLGIYDGVLESFEESSPMSTMTTCTVPSLKTLFILGNMLYVSELLLFLHAPKMMELVIAPTISTDLRRVIDYDYYTDPNIQPPEDRAELFARGVKAAADRYPSLTQLTLATAHPQGVGACLRRASVCFPLVQRLVLVIPERGYLNAFSEAFKSGNINDLGLGEGIMFPNLLELGLHLDLDISLPLRLQKAPDGTIVSAHAYNQHKRLAGWANAITAVRHARETLHGVPLHDVFVDEDTFRAFKFYARGSDDCHMETDSEDMFDMPDVKEANMWENQRRRMLFTEVKDLFLGKPEEGL